MKRSRKIRRVLTRSLVLAWLAATPLAPLAAQQLTAAERAAAVATVWAEARYNFAYWDRVRADWDSALTANLKLAPEPQSDLLFCRRLRRLVALLGDGQSAVIPPPAVRSRIARPPLLLASVTRSVSLNDRWPLEPAAFAVESLPGRVVIVRLNSLSDADEVRRFDRAFPDFGGVQGLVVDLRRAAGGGGRTELGYQILGRLAGKPVVAARWKTPEHRAVFRAWNETDSATTWYAPPADTVRPRGAAPAYGGPIAVLAGTATAGAAEDFLAAFRAAGRGVIVGEPSAGSPGDVAAFPLPKGWTVQFSVSHHAAPDGTEFAGTGIKPDLPVAPTVRDVLAGADPALDRAKAYVSGKRP